MFATGIWETRNANAEVTVVVETSLATVDDSLILY